MRMCGSSFSMLVLSSILVICCHSLYFSISSKPFCIELEQQPGKSIKFFYESSGESPQNTQVQFRSNVPGGKGIEHTLTGERNSTQLNAENPLDVCFFSTDNQHKSISIDFYTHDKSHLMELAKKSEIYELHSKLIEVGENLKEITTNQQFEEQRQVIHSEIITGHENTIKNFAIVKLIAIVAIAGIQLFLLRKMLDKPRGYERV